MESKEGENGEARHFHETNDEPKSENAKKEFIGNAGDGKEEADLLYKIEDVPPWYFTVILGLQQYMTMFGSTITMPFIIAELTCADRDELALGKLISTIFFVSGIVTFLQSTFGVRLPIIQGTTFTFLAPTIAILRSAQWDCRIAIELQESNATANISSEFYQEIWQARIREIQGAVILASMLQLTIGATGVLGLILRFITPITIAPTIGLIGLSLFKTANLNASKYWPISLLTIALLTIFSQYCRNLAVPCFGVSRKPNSKAYLQFRKGRPMEIFKLFPIILTIVIVWVICAILTATVDLPDGAQSIRTDLKMAAFHKADWFRIPYPFQWGMPTFSAASTVGILAGVISSMIESIGDYYAAARFSGAKPPPTSAINRGIFMEGVGCVIAGVWGTGNGTTSYSENIGAIGITKVGSRRVIQTAAIIAIFFGVVTKISALFATIPTPIIGGVFYVMFGLIGAIGISNLQLIDLNSSRNLFVVGLAFFCGLAIPDWLRDNPEAIQTGSVAANQILNVLLSTSMLVGGAIAMLLDNTVPGTAAERGLVHWGEALEREMKENEDEEERSINSYDFPCGMKTLRKLSWLRFCPLSPTWGVAHTKQATNQDNDQRAIP